SLSQSGYFPPILLQIISSGEQSGELDSMLEKAADMQDRELRNTISTLLALISPLMLLVLGGLVMVIVLAMMLPMVSVFNQL
ncbi:MAG: type II secretion system F family protein, partial [Pseudomonadota bacterium]|nr:type II secretion system F family protein [Pseudomonadota bacterium]